MVFTNSLFSTTEPVLIFDLARRLANPSSLLLLPTISTYSGPLGAFEMPIHLQFDLSIPPQATIKPSSGHPQSTSTWFIQQQFVLTTPVATPSATPAYVYAYGSQESQVVWNRVQVRLQGPLSWMVGIVKIQVG
jgi:hypothetical protein